MRAAKNFTFGDGDNNLVFNAGDNIPDKIADQLPDELILEKVAEQDPESLTRDQLMNLAGLGGQDPEELEPIEYDESELRQALGNLRSKADVKEWYSLIRPSDDALDMNDTRAEMVDVIVGRLTGDDEE